MAQPVATIPLSISLRQTTVEALSSQIQDISLSEWLSTRCRQWVENYVNGAIFLTPDQTRRIEEVSGKVVTGGADIVGVVSQGNSMAADGARTFLLSLDPTWVEPIKIRATEMGITVDQFIGDMWAMAMDNNWANYLEPSYKPPVFFPHYKVIQALTGLDRPTGAQIEAKIAELVQVAKAAQKQTAETAA